MADNEVSNYQRIIWDAGLDIDDAVKIMGISRRSFYNNHLQEYPSAPFQKGWQILKSELERRGKIKPETQIKSGQEVVSMEEYRKLEKRIAELEKERDSYKDKYTKQLEIYQQMVQRELDSKGKSKKAG